MTENPATDLRINEGRLWDSLMAMAKIGATPLGGCNRQALTDEDRAGRDLFCSWAREAGCSLRVDRMGNIFARRAGRDHGLPPILMGSHLDTQPTGGKFDGVYGVLSGLEVLRTLNDVDHQTRGPLEVVVWTNEEGARFSPAMVGSGVWSGVMSEDVAHEERDSQGARFADELARIGYLGDEAAHWFSTRAAFETHIEQGPILEDAELQIGVVTGVQGMRWYDLVLEGQASHAGTTPMASRKDPAHALTSLMAGFFADLGNFGEHARATLGVLRSTPESRNTVPARVSASVDLRHPEPRVLDEMENSLRGALARVCGERGTEGRLERIWNADPVEFAPECVDAVRRSAELLGYSHRDMISGAGHDSVYVSEVAPTSMVFVPCLGGLSHNETESASAKDLAAGCNVLLHAVLDRDSA